MSYTAIEADEPAGNPYYEQPAQPTYQSAAAPAVPAAASTTHSNPNETSVLHRLKESAHPVALLFYMFFRISPIFVYLFGDFILGFIISKNRFIFHFIVLILLIAMDFWNLKNISGRLLVGLRWWNEINPVKGSEVEFENVWVFETYSADRIINPIDSKVFWTLLYAQTVAWVVFALLAILKLSFLYLFLVIIAFSLSLTNALAFTKCDKFSKANNLATDLFSKVTGNLLGRLNPFGG